MGRNQDLWPKSGLLHVLHILIFFVFFFHLKAPFEVNCKIIYLVYSNIFLKSTILHLICFVVILIVIEPIY
jgi:hypothetical protein